MRMYQLVIDNTGNVEILDNGEFIAIWDSGTMVAEEIVEAVDNHVNKK